jgi:citrate synthase
VSGYESMSNQGTLDKLIADTLGIPVQSVKDDLAFSEVPQWDSLNHVNLMVALERLLGTEIDEDLMIELTSVRAIRQFALDRQAPSRL